MLVGCGAGGGPTSPRAAAAVPVVSPGAVVVAVHAWCAICVTALAHISVVVIIVYSVIIVVVVVFAGHFTVVLWIGVVRPYISLRNNRVVAVV